MARNEQLIRQHKIIQVLERLRFGATLEELRDTVVEELSLVQLHTAQHSSGYRSPVAAGMPIMDEENQRGSMEAKSC